MNVESIFESNKMLMIIVSYQTTVECVQTSGSRWISRGGISIRWQFCFIEVSTTAKVSSRGPSSAQLSRTA